jgi:hypothetical protein
VELLSYQSIPKRDTLKTLNNDGRSIAITVSIYKALQRGAELRVHGTLNSLKDFRAVIPNIKNIP